MYNVCIHVLPSLFYKDSVLQFNCTKAMLHILKVCKGSLHVYWIFLIKVHGKKLFLRCAIFIQSGSCLFVFSSSYKVDVFARHWSGSCCLQKQIKAVKCANVFTTARMFRQRRAVEASIIALNRSAASMQNVSNLPVHAVNQLNKRHWAQWENKVNLLISCATKAKILILINNKFKIRFLWTTKNNNQYH